jgi:hypothetical protein
VIAVYKTVQVRWRLASGRSSPLSTSVSNNTYPVTCAVNRHVQFDVRVERQNRCWQLIYRGEKTRIRRHDGRVEVEREQQVGEVSKVVSVLACVWQSSNGSLSSMLYPRRLFWLVC